MTSRVRFGAGLVASFASGLATLMYEMLGLRVYSVAKNAQGAAFAVFLGVLLLGLAIGARLSRWWSEKYGQVASTIALAWMWVAGGMVAYGAVALYGSYCDATSRLARVPWLAACVAILGIVFPALPHWVLASSSASAPPSSPVLGRTVAGLATANILGSIAGTVVAGVDLFPGLGVRGLSMTVMAVSLFGATVVLTVGVRGWGRWAHAGAAGALTVVWMWLVPLNAETLYRQLQFGPGSTAVPLATVREGPHGVVMVTQSGQVWGGGTYDGFVHVFPQGARNGIVRAYAASALHPAPKRVLVIGVSTGAWLQVIANNPAVESVTAVEINREYRDVIATFPQVSSILANPKVRLEFDDARRWLRLHPDERFDMIVANFSVHWIAGSAHVLSTQFQELAKQHLLPGGVYYYNSTLSGRALATSRQIFSHVVAVNNFLACSEQPIVPDCERLKETLSAYRIDGRPVFDSPARESDAALLASYLEFCRAIRPPPQFVYAEGTNTQPITDDNVGYEFDDLL